MSLAPSPRLFLCLIVHHLVTLSSRRYSIMGGIEITRHCVQPPGADPAANIAKGTTLRATRVLWSHSEQ